MTSPEKPAKQRLSDCISTFPDTFDNPERDEEMGPGEGDRAIEIAKLKRELHNTNARAGAAELHLAKMVGECQTLAGALEAKTLEAQKAWQERAHAVAENADLERLLKDAVRLLAHFAGMR